MAGHTPTFAEIWTQFGYVVELVNNLDLALNSSPNLISDEADVNLNVGEGVFVNAAHARVAAIVAGCGGNLTPGALQSLFNPFLREMMYLITGKRVSTRLSPAVMLRTIREYMDDNSQDIKTRALTVNAPSASGTPAGDFTIRRLSTDKYGNTIESCNVETITFECIADQNSGTKEHAERFRATGATPYPNAAQWTGSGLEVELRNFHAKTTNILSNPSFETGSSQTDNTALTATTDVTNWTAATAANWKWRSGAVDSSYTYRGYPGAPSTLWALENTASDSLTQTILTANAGAKFNPLVPYFLRLAWMRKASATGNLTLDFGASQGTATIGSATNDVWNHLFIPLNASCWFDVFNQDALDVVITTDTLATGTVVFDDVVLAPMVGVGGHWYAMDGGDTPALRQDKWTSTTSEGTRGKFGYWLWRAYGADGWVPAAASPTIADPT